MVDDWVKSKRITAGGADDAEEDGANRHWRAALRAKSAKNWLEAGFASPAEETEPSGLS